MVGFILLYFIFVINTPPNTLRELYLEGLCKTDNVQLIFKSEHIHLPINRVNFTKHLERFLTLVSIM